MFWFMLSVTFLGFIAYPELVFFIVAALLAIFVIVPETSILFHLIWREGPSAFYSRIKGYHAFFEPAIRAFTRRMVLRIFSICTFITFVIVGKLIFALGAGIFLSIGLSYGTRHWTQCQHTDSCMCFTECRHLESPKCTCYIDKDSQIDDLAMQVKIYKEASEEYGQQPKLSPASPKFPSSQFIRENTQLRDKFTKYKITKESEANELWRTIRQLEAQLNYAQNTSVDRIQMKEKLEAATVKYQESEDRIAKLEEERSQAVSELAAERDFIRAPCEDTNVCYEEKRAMVMYGQELEAKLSEHQEQVQEASRMLGYTQDLAYISLSQFLIQVVLDVKAHAYICNIPLGAPLPRGVSLTEDLIRTLQITNNRNFKYVARLEGEVLSRGGNLGNLQIEGPRGNYWYVSQERKYEEAARIIFFVYGELSNIISVLNALLRLSGQELPPWIDTGHDESLTVMDADRFASTERLSYKLVESECYNLHERALKLLHHCEVVLAERLLLNGEFDDEYISQFRTLQPIKSRMHCLMEFFAYPQDIRYPNNQRLPETTVERRFAIYVGMMNIIREMHTVIYAWHAKEEVAGRLRMHQRPIWKFSKPQVYLPPTTRTTYESLIKLLTKRELDTLVDRIYSLWFHMDQNLKMPGTEQGKKIYADEAKWDIAQPFAIEFIKLKNMWEKARRWIDYWNQRPKPGSIEALDKVPGKDGWLPNPDTPNPTSNDNDREPKDEEESFDGRHWHSNNDYNNQQQMNKKGEPKPPAWFMRSKLENNLKSQRDRLKAENDRHRARIKQLADRLQTPEPMSKVVKANIAWEVPKIRGNFLNIKGGGLENDIYRSWAENEKMKEMIDALEVVFQKAKVQLPKNLWK